MVELFFVDVFFSRLVEDEITFCNLFELVVFSRKSNANNTNICVSRLGVKSLTHLFRIT